MAPSTQLFFLLVLGTIPKWCSFQSGSLLGYAASGWGSAPNAEWSFSSPLHPLVKIPTALLLAGHDTQCNLMDSGVDAKRRQTSNTDA